MTDALRNRTYVGLEENASYIFLENQLGLWDSYVDGHRSAIREGESGTQKSRGRVAAK